tara:strand:- start:132 stop:266 length:135 start_codon:yes stop_codon:yes gene_type:complete
MENILSEMEQPHMASNDINVKDVAKRFSWNTDIRLANQIQTTGY